ncbi:MAG: ferritin-like domain-containing protein [Desulfobacteraceae bacterium]|nr:ferritin-like domain-containing protein [Desulfobacteraceae bacterium]
MKGNPDIISALNARMVDELTAIDQYSAHLARVAVWQYPGLVAYLEERIADETKHFNTLRAWIVFQGGSLATGIINRVNVGADIKQMHLFDRTAEETAITLYRDLVQLCIQFKDADTRAVIEDILSDEIDHLRDLEAQLIQIEQMGIQNYLSARLA